MWYIFPAKKKPLRFGRTKQHLREAQPGVKGPLPGSWWWFEPGWCCAAKVQKEQRVTTSAELYVTGKWPQIWEELSTRWKAAGFPSWTRSAQLCVLLSSSWCCLHGIKVKKPKVLEVRRDEFIVDMPQGGTVLLRSLPQWNGQRAAHQGLFQQRVGSSTQNANNFNIGLGCVQFF